MSVSEQKLIAESEIQGFINHLRFVSRMSDQLASRFQNTLDRDSSMRDFHYVLQDYLTYHRDRQDHSKIQRDIALDCLKAIRELAQLAEEQQ